MDRTVDAAAAQQAGVRGVDDRVHDLLGDVALHCHDVHVTSLPHPAPVFETDRLVVRDWAADEAPRLLDMYSRPEVMRYLGSPTLMASLDEAAERIERGRLRNAEVAGGTPYGWWAVQVRDTGQVAGTVLLVPAAGSDEPGTPVEVGWHLHPDSWGHGYATESAAGAMRRGFAAGLTEIIALVDEANTASQGVCRRLGLQPTAVTEEFYDRPLMVWVARAEDQPAR